jgi:hypothetical protein
MSWRYLAKIGLRMFYIKGMYFINIVQLMDSQIRHNAKLQSINKHYKALFQA